MLRLRHIHRLSLIGFIALCSVLVVDPSIAHACPPPPEGYVPASVFSRTKASDIVMVGAVISTTIDASQTTAVALVERSESIKGDPPETFEIGGFSGHTHLCTSYVRPGETWIFFVDRRGDAYHAHHTIRFDAVARATEPNLAEARIGAGVAATLFVPFVGRTH